MATKKMVKTKVLADLFGLTPRRIQQLTTDEQILTSKKVGNENQYDLYDSIKAYITYIKYGDSGSNDDEITKLERQKLQAETDMKKAKAKMAQLELKEIEGQMHSSVDVEAAVTDMAIKIRSILQALPGQLAVDVCEAKSPSMASAIITTAVDGVLLELAEYKYDPEVYRARVRERKGYRKDEVDE